MGTPYTHRHTNIHGEEWDGVIECSLAIQGHKEKTYDTYQSQHHRNEFVWIFQPHHSRQQTIPSTHTLLCRPILPT